MTMYKYRLNLVEAYGVLADQFHAERNYYEFEALDDQDAADKVGSIGRRYLETEFDDDRWMRVMF